MNCSTQFMSITKSRSSPKLTCIKSVMPSSHLILFRPLLLLPPTPPSIRDFSNESTLRMRWQKYWSFSFSISPSKEHPGLISFRMDWLDLLEIQETVKSLLQHHSSKASILRRSVFFTDQLSKPYMTTGKTIALSRRTFVGKATSLLFNMLSRLVQICTLWSSHIPLHLHVHVNLKIRNLLTYTLTHKQTHIDHEAQPFTHVNKVTLPFMIMLHSYNSCKLSSL